MKAVSRWTFAILFMNTIGMWAQQPPIMAVNAAIGSPEGVITDTDGNLYFSTAFNSSDNVNDCRVFKVDRSGVLTVVAGNSVAGYSGDGGPAVNAELNYPEGLAFDKAGNLYIADSGNYSVRMVTPDGIITTVAGDGTAGYSGDGGPAFNAQFEGPWAVAFDRAGNLYVGDVSLPYPAFGWVRKISPSWIISALAGNEWCYTTCTRSIPAIGTSASAIPLSWVQGMAVDRAANLYISDYSYNSLISYVGNYVFGVSSGGLFVADFPGFSAPFGVAFNGAGNLYVSDVGNNQVYNVTQAGIVATVGSGTRGYSGDGGPAVQAQLNQPTGIAFDGAGNLYIADLGKQRIRKVASGSVVISTAAGGGSVAVPSPGPHIGAVVSGASFQPGIVSNSWITILGTNLSSLTDTWAKYVVNGELPTSLDGVSVDVSGMPAYISSLLSGYKLNRFNWSAKSSAISSESDG